MLECLFAVVGVSIEVETILLSLPPMRLDAANSTSDIAVSLKAHASLKQDQISRFWTK